MPARTESEPAALRRLFLLQLLLVGITTALVLVGAAIEGRTPDGFGFFWFAFLAGCIGSSIGMVRQCRADEDALRQLSRSWTALLMPHLYGGLLAGLTFFLFLSGILSGTGQSGLLTSNLFPDFTGADAAAGASIRAYLSLRPASLADAGKLLVWCFIAGYSESFVIGVLDQLRTVSRPDADHEHVGANAENARAGTGRSADAAPREPGAST